jgi:hypothetical protein
MNQALDEQARIEILRGPVCEEMDRLLEQWRKEKVQTAKDVLGKRWVLAKDSEFKGIWEVSRK